MIFEFVEKKQLEHSIYKNESDKNMVCVKTSLTGISLFSEWQPGGETRNGGQSPPWEKQMKEDYVRLREIETEENKNKAK